MGKKKEENKKVSTKRLLLVVSGGVFGCYVFLLIVESFVFSTSFGPHVAIAGVNVGKKTKTEARILVESQWKNYIEKDIQIEGKSYPIKSLISGVSFEPSLNKALDEQKKTYLEFGVFNKKFYPLEIKLNDAKISQILLSEFNKSVKPAKDAEIILGERATVTPETVGEGLLLADSKQQIATDISRMKLRSSFVRSPIFPSVTKADAESQLRRAKQAVDQEIVIKTELGNQKITKEELKSWVKVRPRNSKSIIVRNIFFEIDDYGFFDEKKVSDWSESLAKKIDKDALNAKVTIQEGKAVITTGAQTGYKLDKKDLVDKILNLNTEAELSAEISILKPEVRAENLGELGIKELLSTGFSDFTGSPQNRVHNFTVGTARFNGVLIKPDEKFSFNNTLGPVDASTGYLPELVIKENKTVPEYGGGMCQVSSTAFRAALNAGLPILERTPHAYPVSYYKPYGVDATIYLPKPDLIFKNDTGKYILIQTRLEKSKIYFDFYGTKANRVIKFSGNEKAEGAVEVVEKITPTIYDQDARGPKSFTAVFYRHIYDFSGKLIDNDKFISKYESPDKYPH